MCKHVRLVVSTCGKHATWVLSQRQGDRGMYAKRQNVGSTWSRKCLSMNLQCFVATLNGSAVIARWLQLGTIACVQQGTCCTLGCLELLAQGSPANGFLFLGKRILPSPGGPAFDAFLHVCEMAMETVTDLPCVAGRLDDFLGAEKKPKDLHSTLACMRVMT